VKPENACGLSETEVRAIAHDIGAGLEFLHRNNVIHRDLKPENVVMQIEDEKVCNLTCVLYNVINSFACIA
jgi:serine/threonine protein kinase